MLKLKDFFYLQRNDRQAILVLLGIIIVCITLVIIVGKVSPDNEGTTFATSKSYVSSTKGAEKSSEQRPLYYKVNGVPHELFPFDPNTADSTQLLKLGLQAWQVRSIYRYRAKGGIFREPSDFARLYGLTKKQYEVLAPYIIIGEDYRPASDYYGRARTYGYDSKGRRAYQDESIHSQKGNASTSNNNPTIDTKVYNYPHKLKPGQHVAINTADTTELMKIPGIGSYYAKTIVRYRDQLGGFAFLSQLREIEGVPEEAIGFIQVDAKGVKKMEINKLSLNQLRRHPYINFYQAKAICDYRRLHGPIKSLEDLKLLKDFPSAEIERLLPYVSF